LRSEIVLLSKKLDEVKERTYENRKLIDVNTNKHTEVDARLSQVEKAVDRESIVAELRDEQVVEEAEREARRNNLVFYKLDEPDESIKSGLERKEKDKTEIMKVMEDIGIMMDMEKDVKFWYRAGGMKEGDDKIRPLIIGFHDDKTKKDILDNARKLNKSTNFKHISIAHDLTKTQRDNDNELRKTVTKRNGELSEEEASNYEWRLLGPKGQRKLVKVKKQKEGEFRKRNRSPDPEEDEQEQRRNTRRNTNT
jgi:ATP-dependent helicase YprA (DUF1998 family)